MKNSLKGLNSLWADRKKISKLEDGSIKIIQSKKERKKEKQEKEAEKIYERMAWAFPNLFYIYICDYDFAQQKDTD